MIVVEGPDGSGKTTLINELLSQFPLVLAPRVVSKDAQAMVDLKRWVEEDNGKPSKSVVYDRHRLISEPIYGPVLRIQAEPGFDDPIWMNDEMRRFYRKKPFIIYCISDKAETLKAEESLPAFATQEEASHIYDMYCTRAAVDCATGFGALYDWRKDSQHLRTLMGEVNRREFG